MILLDTKRTLGVDEVGAGGRSHREGERTVFARPAGRRRDDLRAHFETFVKRAFSDRVLSYDTAAARAYGDIMGVRKEMGRPMSVPEGQIAAITRSRTLTVATRNTRDFDGCGVDLVNPLVKGA